MQSIVAMAISQCLSFIIMAISYERVEFREVCYTLSSIHHYLFLVSLSLAGVYPVLVCIRVFRRMWYEQSWLIGPFVLAATGKTDSELEVHLDIAGLPDIAPFLLQCFQRCLSVCMLV